MDRERTRTEKEEAARIGRVLRLAIPIGRELGWTSERTLREAETHATGADGAMMLQWLEGEVLR